LHWSEADEVLLQEDDDLLADIAIFLLAITVTVVERIHVPDHLPGCAQDIHA